MTLVNSKYFTPNTGMPIGRNFGDTPSFNAMLIDGDGEQVGNIFRVPQSGSISTIRFRVGTVTTGQTLEAGIFTVDTTTFGPTSTAYGNMTTGSVAVADTDDNREKVVTLGANADAAEGDIVCATIRYATTTGSLNVNSLGLGTRTAYNWHLGARVATAPLLAIGYADNSYPAIPGVVPFSSTVGSAAFNVNTASFDEWALKFSVPFKCRLKGARIGFQGGTAADFEIINYDGTNAVAGMTLAVDGDYPSNSSGEDFFYWNTPEELPANTTRYIAVRPTTTTNVNVGFGQVGIASVMTAVDGGMGWQLVRRLNQGAWNEASTNMMPYILPIFDQLDDGASAGGGITINTQGVIGG